MHCYTRSLIFAVFLGMIVSVAVLCSKQIYLKSALTRKIPLIVQLVMEAVSSAPRALLLRSEAIA